MHPFEDWEPSDLDDPRAPPSESPKKSNGNGAHTPDDEPANDIEESSRPLTISDVITQWRSSGALRHEATGIAALDAKTGGGPVYGTRWYLCGAPDAGKTALLIQIAHVLALRGVTVGLLAVDEEAGDLVTRLAQRIGFARIACEVREEHDLATMGTELGGLPLRLYDDRWTIETAAENLAAFAKARAIEKPGDHPFGPKAFLGIDSLQTVACMADHLANLEGRELNDATAVTQRVRAIRRMATKHNLIALATSELGRAAYSGKDKDKTTIMAGAKWSGAVEYSARVLLGLRNVQGEKDTLDLEIAKNKHGPREEHIYLQIDRRSQVINESGYMPFPEDEESATERRKTAGEERTKAKARVDAADVAFVVASGTGVSVREARAGAMARSGAGSTRMDLAFSVLGKAVAKIPMPNNKWALYIDGRLVPQDVLEHLDDDARRLVYNSRPPSQGTGENGGANEN